MDYDAKDQCFPHHPLQCLVIIWRFSVNVENHDFISQVLEHKRKHSYNIQNRNDRVVSKGENYQRYDLSVSFFDREGYSRIQVPVALFTSHGGSFFTTFGIDHLQKAFDDRLYYHLKYW